jgi:DNA-binding NarL/FixJ family response regulator
MLLTGTPAEQAAQPLVTRHTIREMDRRKFRILLAEDNITSQLVALGLLKNMDVHMPEMDGYEATARIRNPKFLFSIIKYPLSP